jgi:hypothetical protein
MVVRSLWAALGEVWVVGLLVGWIVDRLVVCWPVSLDVVVAVDTLFLVVFMGMWSPICWFRQPELGTGGSTLSRSGAATDPLTEGLLAPKIPRTASDAAERSGSRFVLRSSSGQWLAETPEERFFTQQASPL